MGNGRQHENQPFTGSLDRNEKEYSFPPPMPQIGLTLSIPCRGLSMPLVYLGKSPPPDPDLSFDSNQLECIHELRHIRPKRPTKTDVKTRIPIFGSGFVQA